MTMFGFADSQAGPPELPEGLEQDEQSPVGEEVRPALMGLLPWSISILVHVGLILLAVFAVWSAGTDASDEQFSPTLKLGETPQPLQMQQSQERVQPSSQTTQREVNPTRSPSQADSTLETPVNPDVKLLGLEGAVGQARPFGTLARDETDLDVEFMGVPGGNARKVAFLIDASGSLIDTLPYVIEELKKSIQQLNANQQFTIIFYHGDQLIEMPPARQWKRADNAHKQKAIQWIDGGDHNIRAHGIGNPLPALQRAMQDHQAQLVFLLSDDITGHGADAVNRQRLLDVQQKLKETQTLKADQERLLKAEQQRLLEAIHQDQRQLLEAIREANTTGTTICTIQFLYPDPLAALGLKGTMELVAEQNNGNSDRITDKELKLSTENPRE